jgi:hypothetical protein
MSKPLLSLLSVLALSMQAINPVHAAAEPVKLKATSAWNVDYAEERCRLARRFGEGDQSVFLFMDLYGPSEYYRLTIAGKPLRVGATRGEATIQFGPGEQEQQLAFLNGNLGKEPAFIFSSSARLAPPSAAEISAIKNRPEDEWVNVQPISEDRKKAVKYMRIGRPLRKPLILETGSMRAPLAALDTCIENMLASWGVDVEKHKQLLQPTKPLQSPEKWVVSSDYPIRMLSEGQPALVNFRLNIGTDGIPTACYIQATTRPKEFDDAVCKSVMRRAKFSPALDATGRPLASYYQNTVYFRIP